MPFSKKFNAKVPTQYRIICLYSINICYDIFVIYDFLFLLEYVQLQSYQSKLHYYHQHTKLFNGFLWMFTYQDLLCIPDPLF